MSEQPPPPAPHPSKDSAYRYDDGPRDGESRYRLARKGQWYRVEEWRRLLWIGPFGWRVAHRADGFLDETPHPDQMRTRLRVLRCNEAHERATWQPVAEEAADPVGDEAQGS